MFGFGKVNPKRCPDCKGMGVLQYMEAPITPDPTGQQYVATMDKVFTELCGRCRGVGLVNVPGIDKLSMTQIANLTINKTFDDLMTLFKGKTPSELASILKSIPQ